MRVDSGEKFLPCVSVSLYIGVYPWIQLTQECCVEAQRLVCC